jgi:hypothetical protein
VVLTACLFASVPIGSAFMWTITEDPVWRVMAWASVQGVVPAIFVYALATGRLRRPWRYRRI